MREILFRGKRLDNGEWVEGAFVEFVARYDLTGKRGAYIQTIKENGMLDLIHEVDPSTVGQYTGLKDKNGKRIFEGDIVKGEHVLHENRNVFEVVYDETAFCFRDKEGMCWHPDYTEDTEIIGNIHDNKSLLNNQEAGE